MRVLSGMQPSGNPHLGNYLGAMHSHIEMQKTAIKGKYPECFYFIANYHALTTTRNEKELRKFTLNLAIDYLALGLDPDKTIFFKQSDVPEITELAWILDTITPFGLLERAHAWKAAADSPKEQTAGLFNYPVLMAADILIYQSDIVPVGQDQKQHVEISCDIAEKFNHTFGKTFNIPKSLIKASSAVIPGVDGRKMSKSYANVIEIFADAKTLKNQVFSIKTDSKTVSEPKDPKTCIPFILYSFFADENDKKDTKERLEAGGMGYAEVKNRLFERLLEYFAQAREKRVELEKKLDYVYGVLEEGGKKARKVASETLTDVREKTGL